MAPPADGIKTWQVTGAVTTNYFMRSRKSLPRLWDFRRLNLKMYSKLSYKYFFVADPL
jgi:hypothetical protein